MTDTAKNYFPFYLHVCEKRLNFAHVIELVRHIEVLLLESDCVIVPDFGGFTAHRVPASYDREERIFLPPMRTLGFNPQLRINDSLLAQSYINAYDISYPEAIRRIATDVSALKQVLDEEGSYCMSGIGTLMVNDEGNYEFEPCEAGIQSPDYYGLTSIRVCQLGDRLATDESVALPKASSTGEEPQQEETPTLLDFTVDDDDERAISIKMSWVRNAVAVAAAVVAFFFFATPVANSDLGSQAMSNLQGNLLYKLIPQDTNMMPAEPVAEQVIATTAEAQSAKAPTEAVAQVAADSSSTEKPATVSESHAYTYYYIVLASQVKRSNAETFVEQLHKQGYSEAEVLVRNNIVRVVCGKFTSEAEAYSRLSKFHQHEQFEEAWVYKDKTEA